MYEVENDLPLLMTVWSVARTRKMAAKWDRQNLVSLSDVELYDALTFMHRANWLDYTDTVLDDLELTHREITSKAKRYVSIPHLNASNLNCNTNRNPPES